MCVCVCVCVCVVGCRALVATHYQQLAGLTERLSGVGSYKLVAERDSEGIIFTYRVEVSLFSE